MIKRDQVLKGLADGKIVEVTIGSRNNYIYSMDDERVSRATVMSLLNKGIIHEVKREYVGGSLRHIFYAGKAAE